MVCEMCEYFGFRSRIHYLWNLLPFKETRSTKYDHLAFFCRAYNYELLKRQKNMKNNEMSFKKEKRILME